LYGSIAAAITRVSPVVNNLAGLGGAFSSSGVTAGVIRAFILAAFKVLFRGKNRCVIVENSDDRDFLTSRVGIPQENAILIRGIGVDESRFSYSEERLGSIPTVSMVSRLLWPKGVGELVEAGKIIRARGTKVNIQLVGLPDESSRVSVPESQLLKWQSEGDIEWLGYQDDIQKIWKSSNIAVLPSYYREGIPRSLLEAAACGRAIVTTDMPGCREIVRDGKNGLLVPPRDSYALADAVEKLINNPEIRQSMGRAGRALIEESFTEEYVVEQTLAVYRMLLEREKSLA
jgi:glycosyltransferase involved in cell wall biosynthesis